jgi:hypothetical protein
VQVEALQRAPPPQTDDDDDDNDSDGDIYSVSAFNVFLAVTSVCVSHSDVKLKRKTENNKNDCSRFIKRV